MTEPKSRPYTWEQVSSARGFLRRRGYDVNTIKCAQGFNTPLWQSAIPEPQGESGKPVCIIPNCRKTTPPSEPFCATHRDKPTKGKAR